MAKISAAVLAATLSVWSATAGEVVSESVTATSPSVTTVETTPAPIINQQETTTTTETHKLSHDEKERMEKEHEFRKDVRKADRERDEKVREAAKDALD